MWRDRASYRSCRRRDRNLAQHDFYECPGWIEVMFTSTGATMRKLRECIPFSSSIGRFCGDESGNYLVVMGLLLPALVGTVGFATDLGIWFHTHQTMQGAADSAAISAATAGSNLATQADAVV